MATFQTMQAVNKKMDPQKTLKTMQDFQKENMKMDMTEDMSEWHVHTTLTHLLNQDCLGVCVCDGFLILMIFNFDDRGKSCDPLISHITHSLSFTPRCLPPRPVNDTMDDIFEESGDEEESQDIVNQVLDEIGIEISGKVRRQTQRSLARACVPDVKFHRASSARC